MPSLLLRRSVQRIGESIDRRKDASETGFSQNSTRIWIIVAAVAAFLALGVCTALVAISISKRRLIKQQLEEARQRDPCLEQKDFSRRRRMTRKDLTYEAEIQREAMIRKSLASRSGRSVSMSSRLTFDSMSVTEVPKAGSIDEYGLNEEKPLEERLSRPSSVSSFQGARTTSPFPDLPAPALSRSSSPSRLSQVLVSRPDFPPLLEQHPLFQRLNDDFDDEELEELRPTLVRARAGTKEEA